MKTLFVCTSILLVSLLLPLLLRLKAHAVVRLLACTVLAGAVAFCGFGFLSAAEAPATQRLWQTAYSAIGLLCLGVMVWIARKRPASPADVHLATSEPQTKAGGGPSPEGT